jgi:hypothetical protein
MRSRLRGKLAAACEVLSQQAVRVFRSMLRLHLTACCDFISQHAATFLVACAGILSQAATMKPCVHRSTIYFHTVSLIAHQDTRLWQQEDHDRWGQAELPARP